MTVLKAAPEGPAAPSTGRGTAIMSVPTVGFLTAAAVVTSLRGLPVRLRPWHRCPRGNPGGAVRLLGSYGALGRPGHSLRSSCLPCGQKLNDAALALAHR
jgi:hypothetical protein